METILVNSADVQSIVSDWMNRDEKSHVIIGKCVEPGIRKIEVDNSRFAEKIKQKYGIKNGR